MSTETETPAPEKKAKPAPISISYTYSGGPLNGMSIAHKVPADWLDKPRLATVDGKAGMPSKNRYLISRDESGNVTAVFQEPPAPTIP